MKFEIKHRHTAEVLFSLECGSLKICVEAAVKAGAYLTGANLTGANLTGANLTGAYLTGANLTGANLTGAYLTGAYLAGANLDGANLTGANLTGANLDGANLTGAYLARAYLDGANLTRANLTGAYLAGANLDRANLAGANLTGANLTGAYLAAVKAGANLTGAYLAGANLDGKFTPATPEEAIANLDKVREIIIDNQDRLQMGHWHGSDGWQERTCAEEAVCGTTHCLAGWLQVCATEPELKKLPPHIAGYICAPVAAKMFYKDDGETLAWLRDRQYATA